MNDSSLYLKPEEFASTMRRYVLITYYLDLLSARGNLKDKILEIQMRSFENVFKERELAENSVCRKFQYAAADGKNMMSISITWTSLFPLVIG